MSDRIPDYQTLMRPVLQAFSDGAQSVADVLPILRREYSISDEDAAETIPSGRVTILANRAHWARTYMSKAGLLSSQKRNVHVITDKGRKFLDQYPDQIDNKILAQDAEFEDWRGSKLSDQSNAAVASGISEETATPEDSIRQASALMDQALREEVLSAVLAISPARFEQLIIDLLLAMGYGGGDADMGQALGKSGDGGIDGVINEDKLGLDAVYVQAKRYAPENTVGRPAIQAFVGSLTGEGASKGVFVTTSRYSREARDYVDRIAQRVVLIDGDRLARLMITHDVGVRIRQTLHIRSIDEDYFIET